MNSIVINGRFATRPMSGVDRAAAEIATALHEILSTSETSYSCTIATPDAELCNAVPEVPLIRGRLTGQLWEQLELPLVAGNRWLLSLCNTGPISAQRQLLIIHDAQAYLEPSSYTWRFRTWYKSLLPVLARSVKILITDSQFSKDKLELFHVSPRGKIQVVPLGAEHILRVNSDETVFEKHGIVRGNYLLAIGSLSPHKNLAMLMRAAAARSVAGPPLVVAGGGNGKIFADAGLSPPPGVILLGRVTDEQLRALYIHATAFTFPSRTEGFGLPPLEAMLCGCPVIASTGGAIPEVCGSAAVLISSEDEAAWSSAMDDITSNGAIRTELIEKGFAQAEKYRWRSTAAKILLALAESDGDAQLRSLALEVLLEV